MNVTAAHIAAATAVLVRITTAITAKEVAYQATKIGDVLTEREASAALLQLETDGVAVRFSGVGGRLTWRAAE